MNTQKNNPLHGVTLEQIINSLVDYYGWEKLGDKISIKCFKFEILKGNTVGKSKS